MTDILRNVCEVSGYGVFGEYLNVRSMVLPSILNDKQHVAMTKRRLSGVPLTSVPTGCCQSLSNQLGVRVCETASFCLLYIFTPSRSVCQCSLKTKSSLKSTMLFWRRCIPQTSIMIIICHHDNTLMVCLCEHGLGATVPRAIR
jgi:hypothetical protein